MMAHCCEYDKDPEKDELAFAVKQLGETKPAVPPPKEAPTGVAGSSDVPPFLLPVHFDKHGFRTSPLWQRSQPQMR